MSEFSKHSEKPEGYHSLETFTEKLAYAAKYLLTDFQNPSTPEFVKPPEVEEPATFDWDGTLVRGEPLTPQMTESIRLNLGVDLNAPPTYRTTGEILYDAWSIPQAVAPAYVLKREVEDEVDILALPEELLEMFPELGNLEEITS